MTVYRYRRSSVDLTALNRQLPPGGPAVSLLTTGPAIFTDINTASALSATAKTDLDAWMLREGWTFDSTDPTTTPDQAFGANSNSRINALDEGSLVGKSGGLNFVGAGVTVTDDAGNDRAIVTIPGGGGSFDQRDVVVWDHFMTGNVSNNTTGSMGWRVSNTGTGSDVTTAFQDGHPGIMTLVGGTVAAGRAAIDIGEAALGGRIVQGLLGGNISMEWLFKLRGAQSILGSSLEMLQIGFGLDWSADTELADGMYMRFQPGTDSTYSLVTANAGSRTVRAGLVTPVNDVWVRLGLVVATGVTPSVQMFINGVSQGSPITTNLPVGGVGVGAKIRGVTTATAAVCDLDYCLVTQVTAKEGS